MKTTPRENLDFLLEEAQQVFGDRSKSVTLVSDKTEFNKYYLVVEGVEKSSVHDVEKELSDLVDLHRQVLETEGVVPVVKAVEDANDVEIPSLLTPGTAEIEPSKVVAIVSPKSLQESVESRSSAAPRNILAEEEIMKAIEELREMALEA